MTILTKTTAKTLFETKGVPTGQDFSDFIDSCVFLPSPAATGIIVIESNQSATTRTAGAFGLSLLSSEITASAALLFGFSTAASFGATLASAASTASALSLLGITTYGLQIVVSNTTASAQQALGGGAAGQQIFSTKTTASAQNILGTPDRTLIRTISADNVDDIEITALDTSAFGNFEILINRFVPSTAGVLLFARFRRSGVANYDAAMSDYQWMNAISNNSDNSITMRSDLSASAIAFAATASVYEINASLSSGGFFGTLRLFGASDTNTRTRLLVDGNFPAVAFADVRGAGTNTTAAAVDAIQLFPSAGSVRSAIIRIYGLRT